MLWTLEHVRHLIARDRSMALLLTVSRVFAARTLITRPPARCAAYVLHRDMDLFEILIDLINMLAHGLT